MKYAKPEVAVLAPAISAIHGGQAKQAITSVDSPHDLVTTQGAYEADE